jgi:hypothetical protein
MKALIVLTFNVPGDTPEEVAAELAKVITEIDPPRLSHFANQARMTFDPWATTVERWLDEEGT